MLIPLLIFVVCFGGGAFAAAQWLPDLGPGRVAGLAFFAVCGLLAGALGIVGLNIYEIVRDLSLNGRGFGDSDADFLAGNLRLLLLESGTLFGLAAIVYLLAPQRQAAAADTVAVAAEAE